MKRKFEQLGAFIGVIQNVEPSHVPLGGVVVAQNFAQYILGRIQRIPGVTLTTQINVDGSVQIPLLQVVRELGGVGTANQNVAVYLGAGSVAKIVNLSTGLVMTGPALTGAFGGNWSYTFYAQQHLVVGKGNVIQQLQNTTTYAAWPFTGSLTAAPELLQSFLDRLYVVDNTNAEGLVQYSDALTNNFQALNIVNTKEVPGPITALGVYVPSTGTMGIRSGLLIFKRNAIWVWDEASKDIISQKIGTRSPRTIQNTPAGVVFLGQKSNISSVFLIPPGLAGYGLYHFGEPIDIGKPLYSILNITNSVTWYATTLGGAVANWGVQWATGGGLTQPALAHAVVDGKFYKLYFTLGGGTANNVEFWLDLDILTQNPGETREGREPQAIWYGPHTRGQFDASAVGDDFSGPVLLAVRGTNNAKTGFQEGSLISSFLDVNGNILVALLDVPLNYEPTEVTKLFGLVESHIAPEAHVQNNQVTYTPIIDGMAGVPINLTMMETDNSITHLTSPLFNQGRIGASGHHPRIQIAHYLNQRFDLIGLVFEYWIMEQNRIVHHIRTV